MNVELRLPRSWNVFAPMDVDDGVQFLARTAEALAALHVDPQVRDSLRTGIEHAVEQLRQIKVVLAGSWVSPVRVENKIELVWLMLLVQVIGCSFDVDVGGPTPEGFEEIEPLTDQCGTCFMRVLGTVTEDAPVERVRVQYLIGLREHDGTALLTFQMPSSLASDLLPVAERVASTFREVPEASIS